MMLWLVVALMTAAAMGAVLWPLRRRASAAPDADTNDVAVYRDQLDEIERDRGLGLIADGEAQAARVEVSRRLLAAAERDKPGAENAREDRSSRRRSFTQAASAVVLPAAALALYLALGSPGLPGASRDEQVVAAHGDKSIEALFAQVEAHLERDPEDGRGWEVVAPIYMDLGRYEDAVKARANALRLLRPSAEREASYGEALTFAANGIVTEEAKAAFDRAIGLDGRDPMARFYEGLAAEQDGSPADAARIWRALLGEAPQGARWAGIVQQALARVEPSAARASTPLEAVNGAPAGVSQNEMIRGMVERLATRLREDGSDVEGWVRLLRSYKVLGDRERMQATLADARKALANDQEKITQLEDGAKEIENEPAAAPAVSAPPRVAAAPAMPAANEDQMVRNMVERLAARLRQDGSNVDGWLQLVRSYKVLGEQERMDAAAAEARRALANDAQKLAQLEAGVTGIKNEPEVAPPSPNELASAAPPEASAGHDNQVVRDMVERLAARLRQDGSDVGGWIMLVRSYVVLGDRDRAQQTAAAARAALANNADGLRRLEDGLKNLGFAG